MEKIDLKKISKRISIAGVFSVFACLVSCMAGLVFFAVNAAGRHVRYERCGTSFLLFSAALLCLFVILFIANEIIRKRK